MITQKNQEIERKYLIDKIPNNVKYDKAYFITQGYIIKNIGEYTYRLRKCVDINTEEISYYQTIKSSGTKLRSEHEIELTKLQFDVLWELCEDVTITKYRYEYNRNKFTHFIDYIIDLDLYFLEVEFDTIEQYDNFKAPSYVSKDVSENKGFSNYSLALNLKHKKTQLENETSSKTETEI
jgi:CYTH domain-containing protein